jgi:hypothetical protein
MPPQVTGQLLLASQLLLKSLLVASLLITVPPREGWLRSLIPILALLFLDRPVKIDAGLAITLPAGSPEIDQDRLTFPLHGGRPANAVPPVIIGDLRTSHEDQRE